MDRWSILWRLAHGCYRRQVIYAAAQIEIQRLQELRQFISPVW